MTNQEFWKMLGYVFENYDITCATCPAHGNKVCGTSCEKSLKNVYEQLEDKAMKVDVFWERMGTAISNCGDCSICPVHEYATETTTNELCYEVGGCAGGLMMLHRKLHEEERQKMDKERGEAGE